jgi:hypothetical protein
MSLLDRLQHISGFDRIANHRWAAAMYFLVRGEVTRATVISAFNIQPDEENDLDSYKTYYDSLVAEDKLHFHDRVEAAGVLLEGGIIDQSTYAGFFTA